MERKDCWRTSGTQQSGTSETDQRRGISAVPAAVENVARWNAISPVTKSTQMIAEVLSDMRRSQQEVIEAVRPAAIAASMQKDVVSEVAKSLRIPQTMRDSIASRQALTKIWKIRGIKLRIMT